MRILKNAGNEALSHSTEAVNGREGVGATETMSCYGSESNHVIVFFKNSRLSAHPVKSN